MPGSSSRRDWFYYVNGRPGDPRRGRHLGPQGRPDLVGPPRLDRHRLDPGGRRLVPRAVHPRHRAAGGSRSRSSAHPTPARPASASHPSSSSIGVPVASQAIGDGIGLGLARRGRRHLARRPRGVARRADRARPGLERRLRALRGPERVLAPAARPGRARSFATLGAGAGLIAATAQTSTGPAWLITGTDVGGRVGRRRRAHAGAAARPLRARRPGGDRPAGAARGVGLIYRRRASPLHAARAGVGCAYCARARARRAAAVGADRASARS